VICSETETTNQHKHIVVFLHKVAVQISTTELQKQEIRPRVKRRTQVDNECTNDLMAQLPNQDPVRMRYGKWYATRMKRYAKEWVYF